MLGGFQQVRDFIISTDTTADLWADFIKEKNIDVHTLYYSINGTTYGPDNALTEKEFYAEMRNGEMPTTMACNPEEAASLFRKRVQAGFDILHIAFSSALSSSYNNFCIAANEVMEEYPEAKIIVIDSLSASMGEGLVVYRAQQLKDEGKSLEEVADYTRKHLKNFVHYFTVDDLNHLYRGGRVSKTAAVLGSLAGIKPILHVSDEGKLIPVGKVRGRKKSLLTLVDTIDKNMGSYRDETDVIFIGHGDCIEDAEFVAEKIKEKCNHRIIINYICPTIGTHSGPGTLAVFYMGENRL
jgi:DegV family protein with EDD domain